MLQALRESCEAQGVTLRSDSGVTEIVPQEGGFRLELKAGEPLWASQCVVACGKSLPQAFLGRGALG